MRPVADFSGGYNLNILNHDFQTEFLKKLVNHRLEERVTILLRQLDALPYDILANRELDKFYYMQKLAEFKVLDDKLYEALERVSVMMTGRYERRREVMLRWKRDTRWLVLRQKELDEVNNDIL